MEASVIPYFQDLVRIHVVRADFVRCFDWGVSLIPRFCPAVYLLL